MMHGSLGFSILPGCISKSDMFDFRCPEFGQEMKELFDLEEGFVNLNHGSFGTMPTPVIDKCYELSRQIERNPDAFMRQKLYGRIDSLRESTSKLLGVDTDTCVFVPNVSTALNTILGNFQWSTHDTIVHTDAAFESVLLSIRRLQVPQISEFVLPVPFSVESILRDFRKHIQSLTTGQGKVVMIFETITALPALLLPWKEMVQICREEHAWSIIDAAHSLGQESDPNLAEVDPDFWMTSRIVANGLTQSEGVLCSTFPFGINILSIPPLFRHYITQHPESSPINLWQNSTAGSGSSDPVSTLSLEYAFGFREHIGGETKINTYCHELAVRGGHRVSMILGTEVLDSKDNPGKIIPNMVNVSLPLPETIKPSGEFYFLFQNTLLDSYKVFASLFYYRDKWWVRISAQIYNDMEDFEQLGKALFIFCKQMRESQ